MDTQLAWQKDWWNSSCDILLRDTKLGRLVESHWSQTAKGELNGKAYLFETNGFFRRETSIYDADTEDQIGKIMYDTWRNRATIEYGGSVYECRYIGPFYNRWQISDTNGTPQLSFHESWSRRRITVHRSDELLLLAGLHIANHWQSNVAVLVAVLVPILIN